MKKLACAVILFSCFSSPAYSQDTEKEPKKPEAPVIIALDLPLISLRKTVAIERISRGDLNIGSAIMPWSEDLRYSLPLALELHLLSYDTRAMIGGSYLKAVDKNKTRIFRSINGSAEGSAWKILGGAEGFVSHEYSPEALDGIRFKADFTRSSYGVRFMTGLKFGSYSKNFIAVKGLGGYYGTHGERTYITTIDGLEPLPLYGEGFAVFGGKIESRVSSKWVAFNSEAGKNVYRNILKSPNPAIYGNERFEDIVLRQTAEFITYPKHDIVRLLVSWQKRFGSQDSLMFMNDPPEIQVFLRFKF